MHRWLPHENRAGIRRNICGFISFRVPNYPMLQIKDKVLRRHRSTSANLWAWKIPAPRQAVLQVADRDQDHFYVAMGHLKAL
jgi:hypothetical protein